MHHAKARGANILAELCGAGLTSDDTDMVHPDVDGASEAMRLALEDAQIAPTDIDYVNAHGTAVAESDRIETSAIKKAFGKHAASLSVSSTKSMYGHPLGASGSIGAVVCIKAMQEGWIPRRWGWTRRTPSATSTTPPTSAGRGSSPTRWPTRSPSRA